MGNWDRTAIAVRNRTGNPGRWGAALWLLFWAGGPLCAQISPGKLSKPHAHLSSPLKCTACHDLTSGGPHFRCLGCHSEIRQRLADKRGFHARAVKRAGSKECASCHSEHNGENFNLFKWETSQEEFDHRQTGYALEGRHVVACERCHQPRHIRAEERRKIIVKSLQRTFLGLSRDCAASCHADEHRGQLGADCARCHTYQTWKGATKFEHRTAKYQLIGAHETVACKKCHTPAAGEKPYARYTGMAFQTCETCHKDPHRGAFTSPCQTCHNPTGFKRQLQLAGFDHGRTKFALQGKHAGQACGKCHKSADFKQPVAHAACADCHRKDDPHGRQFLAGPSKGECRACHTEAGFKTATFDVAAHAGTAYPLQGRHLSVACAKCHTPKGRDTEFKIAYDQCNRCHRDEHGGQFAGASHENRCQDCHTVFGFRPSTFRLATHEKTRFPLPGAHRAVPCVECHKPLAGKTSVQSVRFRFDFASCETCHRDPHRDQFASRLEARRPDGSRAGCEACHSTRAWRELPGFNHDTTDFRLLGIHRAVACGRCHRPEPGLPATVANIRFKSAPDRCQGCHPDTHAGQFESQPGFTDCARCHNAWRYAPARFNHDQDSRYRLAGAHRAVRCNDCHKAVRMVNGQASRIYKSTPSRCEECHGADVSARKGEVAE